MAAISIILAGLLNLVAAKRNEPPRWVHPLTTLLLAMAVVFFVLGWA